MPRHQASTPPQNRGSSGGVTTLNRLLDCLTPAWHRGGGLLPLDNYWLGMTRQDRRDVAQAQADTGAFMAEQAVLQVVGLQLTKGLGIAGRFAAGNLVRAGSVGGQLLGQTPATGRAIAAAMQVMKDAGFTVRFMEPGKNSMIKGMTVFIASGAPSRYGWRERSIHNRPQWCVGKL